MTKESFAKMFRALAILVPRFAPKFDDYTTIGLWFDAFKLCDERKLSEVCAMIRDSHDEFPSIREIKQLYRAIGGKDHGPRLTALPSDKIMDEIMGEIEGKKS